MSHFRVLHWQQWQPPASAPDPFNINFAFFIGKKTELMAYSYFFFFFLLFLFFYFLFFILFYFFCNFGYQTVVSCYVRYLFIYLIYLFIYLQNRAQFGPPPSCVRP